MTTEPLSLLSFGSLWDSSTPFKLSYPQPTNCTDFFPQYKFYGTGSSDIVFVIIWVVLWGVLREIAMRAVFAPFMRSWVRRQRERTHARRARLPKQGHANGSFEDALDADHSATSSREKLGSVEKGHDIRRRPSSNASPKRTPSPPTAPSKRELSRQKRAEEKKIVRFSEQGWSLAYYLVYWSYGLWIWYNSPWYPFNLDQLWYGFPKSHIPLPAPVKFYYLTQLAFWFHQIVVLHLEARRSDHYQMLTHHFITATLMSLSYAAGLIRVGCIIHFLMDLCDIFLPLAKICKYMGYQGVADVVFAAFLLSWLVTRQVLYNLVVLSVIRDTPRILGVGDCEGCVLSTRAYWTYCTLLGSLGLLMLMWLIMITRVAWRVVSGNGAGDVRSDDED